MFKIEPAKFFVYCALIFGMILIALIPPFQSPDEDSHFKRAYVVSKGQFYAKAQDGVVGFYIPDEMQEYISDKLEFIGNRDRKYTFSQMTIDDRLPKNYESQTFQNFSTAQTTPIAYIAPATGIIFAKIINPILGLKNLSATNMLYFARFFSLLLYIVLIYFAIKTTPILKKTFCLIGLIPMSLALASAISYDSVIIGVCMLATALIFKLIFDDNVKKVNYKYIIAFGVIGFLLLSLKTVYLTILLPLIFVPKEKYGGNIKGMVKTLLLVVCISVAIFALNRLPGLLLNTTANGADKLAVSEQISYIIHNPIEYIKIWLSTMIGGRNYYIMGIFGTFGLIDTYLPSVYMALYVIAFLAIIIADTSLTEKIFNWKYKVIAILGAIASVFGIFLAMYLMWTSILPGFGVGANTITGVQGRYFLPLIPLLIVVFSNGVLQKNEKVKKALTKILDNTYIIAFIMLLVSCVAILLRFWC